MQVERTGVQYGEELSRQCNDGAEAAWRAVGMVRVRAVCVGVELRVGRDGLGYEQRVLVGGGGVVCVVGVVRVRMLQCELLSLLLVHAVASRVRGVE